jgi:hypothetical protein
MHQYTLLLRAFFTEQIKDHLCVEFRQCADEEDAHEMA